MNSAEREVARHSPMGYDMINSWRNGIGEWNY
jgi:hypothetical protein